MDINHLFQPGRCQPGAAFVAVRLLGEARMEWEKVVSLSEAALTEAATAEGEAWAESAAWKRAVNIGKVVLELAAANVARLGAAERRLSLMALAERGRVAEAEGDN